MTRDELRRRAKEDDLLYERHAKHLETEHLGEYVAVGQDGALIVSPDDVEVLQRAIELWGRGHFAFRRIGHRAMGRIR